MYDPPENRAAKRLIQQYARLAMGGDDWPVAGPMAVYIVVNVKRPKSVKRDAPVTRPDIDNYAKLVLDALNGFVWNDDSQVTELHAEKLYALAEPGTSVRVERTKGRYEIEMHARDVPQPFGTAWRQCVQGPVKRIMFEMADLGGPCHE